MFRRAIGSLLTRRFSPRATPRTAPARSLHYLRDLSIRDGLRGAACVAAAAFAGGGALAVQYSKKGPDEDESAARKEEDMKARFQDWVKEYNKSYQSEEEKAMRFQLFKATVDQLPRTQKTPGLFGDWTDQELRGVLAFPDGLHRNEDYIKFTMEYAEKGHPEMGRPRLKKPRVKKQFDSQATGVSS